MSQALLQRNTAHLIQKLEVFLLFPSRQHRGGLGVADPLLSFVPSFSSFCQCPVIDQPHTTQSPTQESFLFGCGIEAKTESFFHISHFIISTVRQVINLAICAVLFAERLLWRNRLLAKAVWRYRIFCPPTRRAPIPPCPKTAGFLGGFR